MALACQTNGKHCLPVFQLMLAGILQGRRRWPGLVGIPFETVQERRLRFPI